MSEIMLNVADAQRSLHTTLHGSRVDALVAALSADPETIEELEAALARFVALKPGQKYFDHWRPGLVTEPWDAGLCVIDLAARVVLVNSTYSLPGPHGCVDYDCEHQGHDPVQLPYDVAADWLFLHDSIFWEGTVAARRRERLAQPRLDPRPVLYDAVCDFIVSACAAEALAAGPHGDEDTHAIIKGMHARWLLTPRPDLGNRSPRAILLERLRHINLDLQHRSHQWSLFRSCPPTLSPESVAYRYSGFGTQEVVVYYYLVRFLLEECWMCFRRAGIQQDNLGPEALAADVSTLAMLRDRWLAEPNADFSGDIPAELINHERLRRPEARTGEQVIIDHDCPLCRMMADESFGPMFMFLDGCNMDDDFAFSFHLTQEEWDAEQRRYEEMNRKFEEDQRRRREAGEDESRLWKRSFVTEDADQPGAPPWLALTGIGAYLAELTLDLKEAGADQALIDGLNRDLGNLTETAQVPASPLLDPVTQRFTDRLADIACAYPDLGEKCADLERRLGRLAEGSTLIEGDDDVPF